MFPCGLEVGRLATSGVVLSTPRLTESVRRRFVQFVSEDRPDPGRWIGDLEAMDGLEGVPACASAVRLLFHLERDEDAARRFLVRLLAHRARLERALGRDPGIRVAGFDLLANLEAAFERPPDFSRADAGIGIASRWDLVGTLDREILRGRRYGVPPTLLRLELDGFRSVSDVWGHLLADQVIERTASILRRTIRESDVACRRGGDGFAIILPETGRIGAWTLAERVRVSVEEAFRAPVGGRDIPVTVSGGVSCCPEDGLTRGMLLERADAALDAARRRGGNRTVLYHDEKRAEVRWPARPWTWLEAATSGDARFPPARLVDLSRGGACVTTGIALEDRGTMRVIFGGSCRGRGGAGEFRGRIVRIEPGAEGGRDARLAVAFEPPLPDDVVRRQVPVPASRGRRAWNEA